MPKLIIAIPAYNEELTLPKVLKDIRMNLSKDDDFLILIVDDGSTDGTVDVAKTCGADIIVCHERNLGVACAYKTAICAALAYGAEIICTIDGDGQFRPDEITKIVEPVRTGYADLVIGSRFLKQENNGGIPTLNKIANKLMARLISLIIGKRLHDTESGFRALSRDAANDLELLGRVSFSNDMILDLSKKGRKIEEVPVSVRYYQTRVSRVIKGFLVYGIRSICLIALKVLYLQTSLRKISDYHPPTKLILVPRFDADMTQNLRNL
jgi:glycosyltransferase involved in cell wall biosynthesis